MRRDLIALPDDSKVWIYQAEKSIDINTADQIKEALYNFTMSWSSHGHQLDCYGHLFHFQFIVFVVDGSKLPSGCSIDSSVHIVEKIGEKYKIDFFDRLNFAYFESENIMTVDKDKFKNLYQEGLITDDSLVFNNLVKTKEEFISKWIIPLNESWHKKFV